MIGLVNEGAMLGSARGFQEATVMGQKWLALSLLMVMIHAQEASRMHAAAAIREVVSGLLSHEVCSVVAMASGLATLYHGG